MLVGFQNDDDDTGTECTEEQEDAEEEAEEEAEEAPPNAE